MGFDGPRTVRPTTISKYKQAWSPDDDESSNFAFSTHSIMALAVGLTLTLSNLRAEDEKKGAQSEVTISYRSPTENIHITGTQITYRIHEEEYENPASSTPSRVVTVTRETDVSPEGIKQLLDAIESAKFYQLKDEYGVRASQRHYPYEIRIKDGLKEKKVIYRSGGDDTQRPDAFAEVEKLLTEFAKRETTVKRR